MLGIWMTGRFGYKMDLGFAKICKLGPGRLRVRELRFVVLVFGV